MYYIGWISLLCGGLVQLNVAKSVFTAISLSKRNLFEIRRGLPSSFAWRRRFAPSSPVKKSCPAW